MVCVPTASSSVGFRVYGGCGLQKAYSSDSGSPVLGSSKMKTSPKS